MQRLSPENFGASDNILTKLLQATWWTLVHKQKLEVHGKAHVRPPDAAIPSAVGLQLWLAGVAAQPPMRRAAGQSPFAVRL